MIYLSDYKTIIVDLDGTLYFQLPVRICMLTRMLRCPWRINDFMIIQKYRRLYARGDSEEERLSKLPGRSAQVIDEWMIQKPISYIRKFRDDRLLSALKKAMKSGSKVIVYSDYPVSDKLKALEFVPTEAYCADNIGCLKPDAAGIMKVIKTESADRKAMLVIGDRKDKDGLLAENIGCGSLILKKTGAARQKQYQASARTEAV